MAFTREEILQRLRAQIAAGKPMSAQALVQGFLPNSQKQGARISLSSITQGAIAWRDGDHWRG
jgi:hypothetical protein